LDEWMGRLMHGWIGLDGWMDGWMNERTDGWVDGWMNGQTDGWI